MTRYFLLALALVGCGDSTARLEDRPDDSASVSAKALLNASGPDISIDQARLQASIRVLANQTVTDHEVEEGCAQAPTGRTLVRFDVRTPNNGPGDLAFGAVTCRSTQCGGARCEDNPGCCCNGNQVCTASLNPTAGRFFEFNCAHGHIHFKSFADYKLLTLTGTVAAQGHKQSFCLMDLDSSGPRCNNPKFTCGNQGISAGCADVYASNLPCSFVDVTNVPQGDYTLEVTMDPLDAINESNESNNKVTAPVRIPFGPPRVDAGTPQDAGAQPPVFLVRDGLGSSAEAEGYYGLNITNFVPGTFRFSLWQQQFAAAAPVVRALYRNKNELGFWREMTCTQTVGRGQGGCWVTNWEDSDDPTRGVPNKGTVAMNLSSTGVTRFYVFNPDGVLSASAVLDSEGNKFVPQLCTTCHSGEYRGVAGGPDLGSIWREFEPSQLQLRPGLSVQDGDAEFFALNRSIKQANAAVRSEAEGAPFGTDHAKAAQAAYLDELFLPVSPPVSRNVKDLAHLPASWKTGTNPVQVAAKAKLWADVVNPYCMSCHRTNSMDYANYNQWQLVGALQSGVPLLRKYIQTDPSDPHRRQLPFMPQSQVALQSLQNDATAQIAINEWLADTANRPPVAAALPVQNVKSADVVSLSAAQSVDPDGDALTYRWEVVSGASVVFAPSATSRDVTFVAPNVTGSTALVIRLTVTDVRQASGTAETIINVSAAQGLHVQVSATDLPIAIPDSAPAGITSTIVVTRDERIARLEVTVDIEHTWIGDLEVTLVGPAGLSKVLHARTGRNTHNLSQTFVVDTAAGARSAGRWSLKVADSAAADIGTLRAFRVDFGVDASSDAPDAGPGNRPPLANAGPDLAASSGQPLSIDGTGSMDPDRDRLTFRWTQLSGPAVVLQGGSSATPSLIAPQVAVSSLVELQLWVSDGRGGSATDSMKFTIAPSAQPSGRLLLAEVMVNPASTDANREWVKIWNGTNGAVDLSAYALGFGGNTTWGDTLSEQGGVTQLRGLLPAGKCLLVGGPTSDLNNAFPLFTPPATYGLGQLAVFTGAGLQNPSPSAPDAIALFNVPAAMVNSASRPIDVVVYHSTVAVPPASRFVGVGGGLAPVNLIAGTDGASGRSFRRVSSTVWEISSGVSGGSSGSVPSPNNCTVIP